ncbi:MAG: hypothetical protein HY074_07335, partial [Deltaproteobacteria bacterium]|nr:hypothetical protein [Deltaproteobacteria bacterium]
GVEFKTFQTTFAPGVSGLQTILLAVNPQRVFQETTYFDNIVGIQVLVENPLKLVAYVNGSQVADGGSVFQAPPSDFVTNSSFDIPLVGGSQTPQSVQLGCVNKITGEAVSGCQFQIQPLALGTADPYSNGGHGDHDGPRPFILSGTESGFKYDGAIHSVDNDGQNLQYWPSIVAGDVVVKISGFDPQGNPIDDAPPITFRVQVPNLSPLSGDSYTFKCTLDPNNSGCPGGGYEHESFYNVISSVNGQMSSIGVAYDAKFPNAPSLIVNDASLGWGGLYDFTNSWAPPHKYHRQGTDIDVNSKTVPDDNSDKLEDIVCKNGGFPKLEQEGTANEHYHLYFYVYGSTKISTFCPGPEVGPQ